MDLVSIITPCYNSQKYVRETIDSVIAQTYTNWEMIIIDDGSKDDTFLIACEYASKDKRINVFQQKNSGSAAARNNGIKRSKGRYIVLLDSDDVLNDNFLEEQIRFLTKNKVVCVCSGYQLIDENSKSFKHSVVAKKEITVKDMKVMNRIGCLTGVYDSSKYGKKFLDESLHSVRDDYAYWYSIVCLEGLALGNQKTLAKYRVVKNSTTGNKVSLIKTQYHFYKDYLKLNYFSSFINLIKWGLYGLYKFYRP